MPHTVVFLWISAAAGGFPSPGQAALISDFGAARGLAFVSPTDAAGSRREPGLGSPDAGAYDAARVDALEGELEQARTALAALEEEAASARLARVEAELLAHALLPQAPFLMAECLALQAQALRESDPARAAKLDARRRLLEGPRAPAFGEAEPQTADANEPLLQAVELEGLRAGDRLELDGVLQHGRVSLAPGLHHARVERAARPIFAGFFELAPGQLRARLAVPPLLPCSEDDLAGVSVTGEPQRRSVQSSAVECSRWAVVEPDGAGIRVALCEKSRCGAFVTWARRDRAAFAPLPPRERTRVPAWATFTVASAAAVLATGLVLWQSGAFESGSRSTPTWRYGGYQEPAVRF